jgi:hypothetical protein
MAGTEWRVLAHDPIEKLEDNLWRVEGAIDGMPLRRVMTIAKRSDGKLVIHNAIALEEGAMNDIEAFGEPAYLVVPNGYHRIDAPRFKARYPSIRVVCPKGARAKVAKVVPVDLDYSSYPADADVTLEPLAGVGDAEGIMMIRSSNRVTLVFNDMLFNMPHLPGAQGFIMKHVFGSSGGPKVPRVARLFIMKDKAAFRHRLASRDDLCGRGRDTPPRRRHALTALPHSMQAISQCQSPSMQIGWLKQPGSIVSQRGGSPMQPGMGHSS